MGIRFHCPQGHKLNVKSFLAGKKGVCPKCGTKLRIPEASEPGLAEDGEDSDANKLVQKGNGSVAVAAATRTAVAAAAPAAVGSVSSGSQDAAAPPAPAAPSTGGDPIAEAPSAVWYVRPPTGGQYGPARGDIFRRWIAEGRVSSDSLVWREGWTDWRSAGQLFPDLNAGTPSAAAAPVLTTPSPVRSAATSRYRAKKNSGSGMAVTALVVLGLLCAVLVGVLVWVLTNLQ